MSSIRPKATRAWHLVQIMAYIRQICTTDHQFQSMGLLSLIDSRFKRFMAWLRRPLSIMIISTVISLICGLLINERAVLVAFFLGIMIRLGCLIPCRFVNSVDVALMAIDDRIIEGQSTQITIVASSINSIPVAGIAVETGLPEPDSHKPGDWTIQLPVCWQTRQRITAEWVSQYRGIFPAAQPAVACSFPFQLRKARKSIVSDFRLIVHPQTCHMPELPEFPTGIEDVGSTIGNRKGYSGDTVSLRPFRQGDDPRRIHWPQTARTGSLVVKEQQAAIKPHITVHLGDPAHYPGWMSDSSARLAGSIIETGLHQGWHCELLLGESQSGQRLVRNCRRELFLDVLAAFGNCPEFIMQNSESAAAGMQPDRLHLKIETPLTDFQTDSHFQQIIFLGHASQAISQALGPVWKHFFDEAGLSHWLCQKRA
ncbi:MAG: DUF58 domain-containing protein [bacterium]